MLKKFSEMTQSEINAMSKEDYLNVSPFEKKSCYDCNHLKQLVTYWCQNKEAIEARGTKRPGCIKCPFWEPDWSYINSKYKTVENGYIPIIKKVAIHSGKTLKWFKRLLTIK